MGLDIFAASHLRYVRPVPRGKAFDRLEAELARKGKSIGDAYFLLSPNQACFRQRLSGMKPGLYAYTRATRRYSFRAGSYSGYNWWRNQLSLFIFGVDDATVWGSPRDFRGDPFVELINFTDCDGRIGTRVSAKLGEDFTTYARSARKHTPVPVESEDTQGWDEADQLRYWRELYRDFGRAFRLAAKNGALEFC
jgi:hypothetical protein